MDIERLNSLAMEYVNTPHVSGGNIKGAGLDCTTLPANFFHELGYGDFEIPEEYPDEDWYCKRDCEEQLLPQLERYCVRVPDLEPGDVISYRWGRAQYAHLAIFLGNGRILHCQARDGVEITDITAPYLYDAKGNSRVTGYWRVIRQ